MPSLTTFYRAFVMIAAGIIIVKGWQLYGPTTEQVKSFGVRAIEIAQVAWTKVQTGEAPPAAPPDDPRLAAASAGTQTPPPGTEPAPLFSSGQDTLQAAAAEVDSEPAPMSAQPDGLTLLYSRLEELGAYQPQLGPWGSSGQMYRCSCRAALSNTPALTRHFEAVAGEPHAAMEQLVAKVEAWRAIERGTELR